MARSLCPQTNTWSAAAGCRCSVGVGGTTIRREALSVPIRPVALAGFTCQLVVCPPSMPLSQRAVPDPCGGYSRALWHRLLGEAPGGRCRRKADYVTEQGGAGPGWSPPEGPNVAFVPVVRGSPHRVQQFHPWQIGWPPSFGIMPQIRAILRSSRVRIDVAVLVLLGVASAATWI